MKNQYIYSMTFLLFLLSSKAFSDDLIDKCRSGAAQSKFKPYAIEFICNKAIKNNENYSFSESGEAMNTCDYLLPSAFAKRYHTITLPEAMTVTVKSYSGTHEKQGKSQRKCFSETVFPALNESLSSLNFEKNATLTATATQELKEISKKISNFYQKAPPVQQQKGITLSVEGQTGHWTSKDFFSKLMTAFRGDKTNLQEALQEIKNSDVVDDEFVAFEKYFSQKKSLRNIEQLSSEDKEKLERFKESYLTKLSQLRAKTICSSLKAQLDSSLNINCTPKGSGSHGHSITLSEYEKLSSDQQQELNQTLRKVNMGISANAEKSSQLKSTTDVPDFKTYYSNDSVVNNLSTPEGQKLAGFANKFNQELEDNKEIDPKIKSLCKIDLNHTYQNKNYSYEPLSSGGKQYRLEEMTMDDTQSNRMSFPPTVQTINGQQITITGAWCEFFKNKTQSSCSVMLSPEKYLKITPSDYDKIQANILKSNSEFDRFVKIKKSKEVAQELVTSVAPVCNKGEELKTAFNAAEVVQSLNNEKCEGDFE